MSELSLSAEVVKVDEVHVEEDDTMERHLVPIGIAYRLPKAVTFPLTAFRQVMDCKPVPKKKAATKAVEERPIGEKPTDDQQPADVD